MSVTEYISEHPKIALIVGLAHITFAEFLHNVEIPKIIMQLFQIGAWSITITVGLITIAGFLKKKFKK